MHIQVNAERLRIAYQEREQFINNLKGTKQVKDIVSSWNIFFDFPITEDTKVLLNHKEYYILCKFESYKKEEIFDDIDVIVLDPMN